MANPSLQGKNQFGEEIVLTLLQTPASLQALATALPAKAEVLAISQLDTGTATTAQIATAVNALLTALAATT